MRLKTRERAARIVLASLLGSDLTIRELKELADGLSEHSFSWELSDLLRDTLRHLTDFEEVSKSRDHPDELEELAYTIVQRRRLPKRMIIEYMRDAASIPTKQMIEPNLPIREMLRAFFRTASLSDIDKFMDMIQGNKRTDAYLKGIIRRN
jgi:hypothetical protein